MFIEDKKFSAANDKIKHAFFGRQGGVSEGIYNSLNCGAGSQDNTDNIVKNKHRVAAILGCKDANLITMNQTHSAVCLYVEESSNIAPQADAIVTDKPGITLGVLTADCAPVLFFANKENGELIIGAAHAGYKGALTGILQSSIEEIKRLGGQRQTMQAVVGPCIQQSSYEVRSDFALPFLQQDPANDHFFKSTKDQDHLMFDLPGYIGRQLSLLGLEQVSLIGEDTYSQNDKYFSYRRSTHKKEQDYGRQISAVLIRD